MSESPQSEQRPSGRKGSRKVRTGCITCKVRKVKCDEAKPTCLRCLKSGRKCDGYPSSTSRSQALLRHMSPTIEFESANGRRAFDYYHARLIPILGGIYTSEFWGETVLQLSLTEPVVHHSLLSLSSFLECELAKDGTDHARKPVFAFSEYGKAINAMRNWRSDDGSMAVPLLVCVLFTCIEFLLDRSQVSQLHICQGRKLLSQLEDVESSALDLVKRDLVPIYARLSLASFLFGTRPEAIPDTLRSSTATPVEFKTLRDAKNRLYHLLDDALRFTTQAKPAAYATPNYLEVAALEAVQQSLLNQLSDWNNSFTMLTTNLAQSTSLRISQNLLQIYYHAAVIWICTALQPLQLAYDNHIAAFASIISLASAVVNQTNASKKLPEFSFETELIAPLYWTATKCRHPTLRRAALRLLLKDELRNRKENLWHARETIIIASRIIEMEEQGLDTTVAETKAAYESPEQEFTLSTPTLSDSTSSQWSDNELHVPLSKPPTLPPPAVTLDTATVAFDGDVEGEGEASFNRPVVQNGAAVPEHPRLKSAAHMASSLPVHMSVSPPFDIPETKRVKNTLIGPREPGGIWITVFRDLNTGQQNWDITKEFLAV